MAFANEINRHIQNNTLKEFRSVVETIEKEGIHFKPYVNKIGDKVSLIPTITYKDGDVRGFLSSDLNKDHRIYIEKKWSW